MAEVFSLQDIYGAPVSIVDINYEFNFLGDNTRLIGVKTVSYPPIDDSLVEKEVEPVEKEEGSWGLNLFLGGLVTAACATVAVVAVVVAAPVAVVVVAGCAAVGAAAVTAHIAMTDYRRGKARPWYEALGESILGAAVGAVIGEILVTSYPIIAGEMEALPGLLNSMFGGGGSQALALAGGGTWELESAGVLEGILAGVLEGSVAVGLFNSIGNMNKESGNSIDYYKKGLKEIPKDWIEVEAPEELPIKSESFKKFLQEQGFNPKNWKKVVEKWASPDGKIYQRNYWTNGKNYYYHGEGIEEFFPH